MPGRIDSFYWDTCLFLAWLKDEKRDAEDMDGIREEILRLRSNEIQLVTSTLTLTEILPAKVPANAIELFVNLTKRRNVHMVDLTRPIAREAGELRDFYAQQGGKSLGTPDAIHLATAIKMNVDSFHTFDEKDGRRTLGLIGLSGDVAGRKLTICKPQAGSQRNLPNI